MLWVTRAAVHLDRVASPWLIARFLDPGATFGFVQAGEPVPASARGFGLPGSEFPPHDADGSTFRKLMRSGGLVDRALLELADMVETGIAITVGQPRAKPHPFGAALAALAEGLSALHVVDQDVLDRAFPLYDALYASSWAARRDDLPTAPAQRFAALREVDWASVLRPPRE